MARHKDNPKPPHRVFGVGNGAEVGGKLVMRWDAAVAGRNRALNRGFGRCLREVRWSVCASTHDEKKEKEKRPIDNRLVLNKKTLNAPGAQEEEIAGIIDSRIGVRIREVQFQPGMHKN